MPQNNNLAPQKVKFSVAIQTADYQKLINQTLGDKERARTFISSITSAVAVNPLLQECDAGTILAGALLGESLNLSPSPQLGQYYLVPFDCKVRDKNGKIVYLEDENGNKLKDDKGHFIPYTVKKAQYVMGYKGYQQLAIRSGQLRKLTVLEIKEGELRNFDPLNEVIDCIIIEDPDKREEAPTVGYYAMFECINGFRKAMYWSKAKMIKHADTYSPAFSAEDYKKVTEGAVAKADMWKYSSFWYKNFDDMAKKTMLRQLITKGGCPMSIEMRTAYEKDESTIEINGNGFVSSGEGLAPITLADISDMENDINAGVQKIGFDEV